MVIVFKVFEKKKTFQASGSSWTAMDKIVYIRLPNFLWCNRIAYVGESWQPCAIFQFPFFWASRQ